MSEKQEVFQHDSVLAVVALQQLLAESKELKEAGFTLALYQPNYAYLRFFIGLTEAMETWNIVANLHSMAEGYDRWIRVTKVNGQWGARFVSRTKDEDEVIKGTSYVTPDEVDDFKAAVLKFLLGAEAKPEEAQFRSIREGLLSMLLYRNAQSGRRIASEDLKIVVVGDTVDHHVFYIQRESVKRRIYIAIGVHTLGFRYLFNDDWRDLDADTVVGAMDSRGFTGTDRTHDAYDVGEAVANWQRYFLKAK